MATFNQQKILEQANKTLKQLNEKNPYAVVFGLIFIILVVDYIFLMQFQVGALRALNPKVTASAQEIVTTRNNIQRLPQYQREVKQLASKLERMQNKIRTRGEFPLILKEISEVANNQGVMIDQIVPNITAEKKVLKNTDGQYFSIPVVIEARSGYHNFGKFLNELERGNVLFSITDFTVASGAAESVTEDIKLTLLVVILEK